MKFLKSDEPIRNDNAAPTVSYKREKHEREGTGKGAPRRRRTSREARNVNVLRGPRLAVGLLGTRGRR